MVLRRVVPVDEVDGNGEPGGVWPRAVGEPGAPPARAGQRAEIHVDGYPEKTFTGVVNSVAAGTGARFSLLPPENATGNWVKVVQRVPVKILLDQKEVGNPQPLRAGMSAVVTIRLR